MNRLVIIGNGFDLVHILPTRYEDFILNYLESIYGHFFRNGNYEDDVLKLIDKEFLNNPRDNERFFAILKANKTAWLSILNNSSFFDKNLGWSIDSPATVEQKNEFIGLLLKKSHENWVDIEQFYYGTLLKVAQKQLNPNNRDHRYQGSLGDLNEGFRFLKQKLEAYLLAVEKEHPLSLNRNILDICMGNSKHIGVDFEDDTNTPLRTPDSVTFLNFNYTNTVSTYVAEIKRTSDLQPVEIQIHGRAGDTENPIIFGFGDEMDDHYKLLEKINNNRYLDYMKSFGYFKTHNYRKLEETINTAPFEVRIMGHSCGLSDRVMLNMIFEHANCKSIKVFYYQDKAGNNNFLDLSQNISRHFNLKGLMRRKVRSEVECVPLPQNCQK